MRASSTPTFPIQRVKSNKQITRPGVPPAQVICLVALFWGLYLDFITAKSFLAIATTKTQKTNNAASYSAETESSILTNVRTIKQLPIPMIMAFSTL